MVANVLQTLSSNTMDMHKMSLKRFNKLTRCAANRREAIGYDTTEREAFVLSD